MPNWNDKQSILAWAAAEKQRKEEKAKEEERKEQAARQAAKQARERADKAKQDANHAAAIKNKVEYGPVKKEDAKPAYSSWRDVRTPERREEDEEDKRQKNKEQRERAARSATYERVASRDDVPTTRVWDSDKARAARSTSQMVDYSGTAMAERAQKERENEAMRKNIEDQPKNRAEKRAQQERTWDATNPSSIYQNQMDNPRAPGRLPEEDVLDNYGADQQARRDAQKRRAAEEAVQQYRAAERLSQGQQRPVESYGQPPSLPGNITPEYQEAITQSKQQREEQAARQERNKAATDQYPIPEIGATPAEAVGSALYNLLPREEVTPQRRAAEEGAARYQDYKENNPYASGQLERPGTAWVNEQYDEMQGKNKEMWAEYDANEPNYSELPPLQANANAALRAGAWLKNQATAAGGGTMWGFEKGFEPTYNAYTAKMPGSAEYLEWEAEQKRLEEDTTPEGIAAAKAHKEQPQIPNPMTGEVTDNDLSFAQFIGPYLGAANQILNPFYQNKNPYDKNREGGVEVQVDSTTLASQSKQIIKVGDEEYIVDTGSADALYKRWVMPTLKNIYDFTQNTIPKQSEYADKYVTDQHQSMQDLNEYTTSLPEEVQDDLRPGQINQVGGAQWQWDTAIALKDKGRLDDLRLEAENLYSSGRVDAANYLTKYINELDGMTNVDIVYEHQQPIAMLAAQIALDPLNIIDVIAGIAGPAITVAKAASAANKVNQAEGAARLASAMHDATMLNQRGGVTAVVKKRSSGMLNILAKTPEALASADRDVIMGVVATVTSQVQNVDDARLLMNYLTNNPQALLVDGVQGLTSPFFQKLADQGLKATWGASALANDEVVKRAGLLAQIAERAMKAPSLQSGAPWNPVAFIADMDALIWKQALNNEGVAIANDVPFGAADFKLQQGGQPSINFIDEKGRVLHTTVFDTPKQAEQYATKLRDAINKGSTGAFHKLLRAPDTVTRALMSDVWLNLRPGHWVRNALAAGTAMTVDGTMNFTRTHAVRAYAMKKGLAGAMNPRLFEAINNTGRTIGAAAEAFGDQPHWSRGIRSAAKGTGALTQGAAAVAQETLRPLAWLSETGSKVWSGNTELLGLPIGEQNFYSKAWFGEFQPTFNKLWNDIVDKGVHGVGTNEATTFASFLRTQGVNESLVNRIVKSVIEAGQTGSKEDILNAVNKMLNAPTSAPHVTELGIDVTNLSNNALRRIEAAKDAWFTGPNPQSETSIKRFINTVNNTLDNELRNMGDIANEAPPMPGTYVWQEQEVLAEAAELADDMAGAARKANIPPDQAAKAASEASARYHAAESAALNAITDAIKNTPDHVAVQHAVDAYERIYAARQKMREAVDALGGQAADTGNWNRFWTERPKLNDELAKTIQKIADETKAAIDSGKAPAPNAAAALVDRVLNYDKAIAAAAVAAGQNIQSTVQAQKAFEDLRNASRAIIDSAEAGMYRVAQAYPTTEAVDMMFSATQRAQLMGAQVSAYLTPRLNDALAGILPWEDYYRLRNETWTSYYKAVEANDTATSRSIVEHFKAKNAKSPNDTLNSVAEARDAAAELRPRIKNTGDKYGQSGIGATGSGSGSVFGATPTRNRKPTAGQSGVQGVPYAPRSTTTGLREVITERGRTNNWSADFTAAVADTIEQLPANTQRWYKANPDKWEITHYAAEEDAPEWMRKHLRKARGLVLTPDTPGPKQMLFGPSQFPTEVDTFAHETVHMAWDDLYTNASPEMRQSVEDAANTYKTAAQEALRKTTNTGLYPETTYDKAAHAIDNTRRGITRAQNENKLTPETIDFELYMALAWQQWDDFLEAENLPTGQAGVLTVMQALADELGFQLPEAYQLEEVIAYHAGQDPNLLNELFYQWENAAPAANAVDNAPANTAPQFRRRVQGNRPPLTDAELDNLHIEKKQRGDLTEYTDTTDPDTVYILHVDGALSRETTTEVDGRIVQVRENLGIAGSNGDAERRIIFDMDSGQPIPTEASDTVEITDISSGLDNIISQIDDTLAAPAATAPVNGSTIRKAAAQAGIPTLNDAGKPTDNALMKIAKSQGADTRGKKKVEDLTQKEQDRLFTELARRKLTGEAKPLEAPKVEPKTQLDNATADLQKKQDERLLKQSQLAEQGITDPKLEKQIAKAQKQLDSLYKSGEELRKAPITSTTSGDPRRDMVELKLQNAEKTLANIESRIEGATAGGGEPRPGLLNNRNTVQEEIQRLEAQLQRLGPAQDYDDPVKVKQFDKLVEYEKQAQRDLEDIRSEMNEYVSQHADDIEGETINTPEYQSLVDEYEQTEQRLEIAERSLETFNWDADNTPKPLTTNDLLGLDEGEDTEEVLTDIMRVNNQKGKAPEVGDTAISGQRNIEQQRQAATEAAERYKTLDDGRTVDTDTGEIIDGIDPEEQYVAAAEAHDDWMANPHADDMPPVTEPDIQPNQPAAPTPRAPAPQVPDDYEATQRGYAANNQNVIDNFRNTGKATPAPQRPLDQGVPLTDAQRAQLQQIPAQAAAAAQKAVGMIKNNITPYQQRVITEYVNELLKMFDNATYASSKAADRAADFAMLNFKDRRNFDNILSTIFPYHYFWTRSAGTWAQRVAKHPAALAHYMDTQTAIETENEQSGVPNRMKGTIPLYTKEDGTQVRIANITDFTHPFAMWKGNDFNNPTGKETTTEQIYMGVQKYTPGLLPYWQYAAQIGLDWADPLPNGEKRTDATYVGGLVPQLRVAESAYRAVTGEDTRFGDSLNDKFVPYVDRRSAALDAVGGTPEEALNAANAQQISTNLENDQPRYMHIPQDQIPAAEAAYKAAVQNTGQEKLMAQAANLMGAGLYQYTPEEKLASATAQQYAQADQSAANPYGSEQAQSEVLDKNKWLKTWWTKAGDPGADQGQPAIQAQKQQQFDYRSGLYDQRSQEIQQAVKDAIAANPQITTGEMSAIAEGVRAKYQPSIDEATANIDALEAQAEQDRFKYAGDGMPTPEMIGPELPNPLDPNVATGQTGVDVPTLNQHDPAAQPEPFPSIYAGQMQQQPVPPTGLPATPPVQIGDPRALGNGNALGAIPLGVNPPGVPPPATTGIIPIPSAPVAQAPAAAMPSLIEAANAADEERPNFDGMSADEQQEAYNEWVFKVANKLPDRPTVDDKPIKPAPDASDEEWDTYNAAYDAYNKAFDAYDSAKEQFIVENLTNPTQLTGLNPMTAEEATEAYELYRQANMSPEEVARRQEIEVIQGQRDELQTFYDQENYDGAKQYLLTHPELAAQLRYEKEGAGDQLWIDKPPGAGAANTAIVNEKYGPEAVQMVEEYLSLEKGDARAQYAAEHPEIKAYTMWAFSPDVANEFVAAFGEEAVDVYAGIPQWGEDEAAQEAYNIYMKANPDAYMMKAWLDGRPEPFDPDAPAQKKEYNQGQDWEKAKELFGDDIWTFVFSYKQGDRSSEVKQKYYAFIDWWNANYPDDGKEYTGSGGSSRGAMKVASGDWIAYKPGPNDDPRTPAEGGTQYDPGNGRYPPNMAYLSSDGLVAYDAAGRRIDGSGNTGPTSHGNAGGGGGGGGYSGGGGSYSGGGSRGGYAMVDYRPAKPPTIRSWRGDNPWYSGSWLNAGKGLGPK